MATEGPVLVLAGAGSGKTRTLTHRIAHIIRQGLAEPEQIFAVTFTNKAAQEMRARVAELLGGLKKVPKTIGTFHALAARMLREQHQFIGRTAGFTIVDTGDSERLIRQALKELNLNPRQYAPRALRDAISRAKNEGRNPESLLQGAASEAEETAGRVYERYQKWLKRTDSFDFDDLLLETIRLLEGQGAVRQIYQQRWRYLSVDEYQDTNPVQDLMLRLLLGKEQNLYAVGDDYQAIYSWRGARVDHILRFERSFPGCQTVYLTQNYRSTKPILNAANRVIAENKEQKHKELWTTKEQGQPVRVLTLQSDREEAQTIRRLIAEALRKGPALPELRGASGDFAILYRTNAQSRLFEEEFIRYHIPYTIVGGIRFYERSEVKDALGFLQLLSTPQPVLALKRLLAVIAHGVGEKAAERLAAAAEERGITLREALFKTDILPDKQRTALRPLALALKEAEEQKDAALNEVLRQMLERSGYRRYLKELPDGEDREENIGELLSVASGYSDATSFLEAAALMSDADEAARRSPDKPQVWCMTLHAAKGLEFPHVYLAGCEEGLLPHQNSLGKTADMEEERRLLYVGMTRARETLTLSYALFRTMWGEGRRQTPSRFLNALPEAVERWGGESQAEAEEDSGEPVYVSHEIGDMLTHPIFGRGVVIEAAGSKMTCVFEGYGVKKIYNF